MSELIDALGAATEGSRELDVRVARALGRVVWQDFGVWLMGGTEAVRLPHFTTSVDAALTLVSERSEGRPSTALAICIAAMREHEAAGWQPIETAPEKTRVLWLYKDKPESGYWQKSVPRMDGRSGPLWWGGAWINDIPHGAEILERPEEFPTKWRPLPAAP